MQQQDTVGWLPSSGSEIKLEDDQTWPKLPSENPARHFVHGNVCTSQMCGEDSLSDVETQGTQVNLDNAKYSKLGVKIIRFMNPGLCECHSSFGTDNEINAKEREERYGRQCKRSEKIYINLHELLENGACIKSSTTKDFSKLNFPKICEAKVIKAYKGNISVVVKNPLEKDKETDFKKIRTSIGKPRKSKLKRVVLLSRSKLLLKAGMGKIDPAQMAATTKEINDINFNALKITADPKVDVNYVKDMSELTFYGKNYRNPKQENIAEDSVEDRPDIIDKFSNLFIKKTQEKRPVNYSQNPVQMHVDESDIIQKTSCLKINDDIKQDNTNLVLPDIKVEQNYSQNFKKYYTNALTSGLNKSLDAFLYEIKRLQKKLYDRDNVKGRYKRRYFSGLKQVRKYVELKKVLFVVIASDIERVELQDGLDDEVYKLLESCRKYDTVFCFGLRRRKLGYYTHGNGFVSCIGITNYSNIEEAFKNVLMKLVQARNEFRKLNGELAKITDLARLMSENTLLSEDIRMLMKILTCNN